MATLRAVRDRIASVEKIKKIAGALEIVALTRLRRMEAETITSRNYFERIRELLFDVASNINFESHPFLKKDRPVKNIGLISIFSDKGLCGNFNANLHSRLSEFCSAHKEKKVKTIVIGRKGTRYLRNNPHCGILNTYSVTDKQILEKGILEIARSLIDKFLNYEIDEIFLLYSRFRLHLLGEAKVVKLLPFTLEEKPSKETDKYKRDYIYEPDTYEIFDDLVREYIINQIHQAISESRCAEEMSRMLAMKSATDNSDDMISGLRLVYNKNRQAQITKELAEIISAAEAAG